MTTSMWKSPVSEGWSLWCSMAWVGVGGCACACVCPCPCPWYRLEAETCWDTQAEPKAALPPWLRAKGWCRVMVRGEGWRFLRVGGGWKGGFGVTALDVL